LLVVGAVGGWWFWPRPPAPEPPAVPGDIRDPAVREAIEADRRSVLESPRSADAWGGLGMALLAYLYHEQADRCFAEASRLDPDSARWLYYRYSIASWLDPPQALPFLQQAVQIGSPVSQEQLTLRMQLADLLLEQKQLDAAERLYREELRKQSDQPRAALGLGLVLIARGAPEDAVRYLKTAQASPYTKNRATTQLAILARQRGDNDIAADQEQKAAALPPDPDWPDPFMRAVFQKRVGRAQEMQDVAELEREQRYEEAAAVALRRAEREPNSARHHVSAGLNLARAGRYDRAVEFLKKAIQLEPDNCVPYYDLARTLYERAEAEWKRSPGSADGRKWYTEAAGAAEQATIRKRDHAEAYLIWGRSLLRVGPAVGALAPLQRGVACRPESFGLQLALGETLLETGQRKDAAIHLENARKLKPDDPQLLEVLKRLENSETKTPP
jgi:tetratricopeptide (TPR) repeat protein